jgi:hypothetical protein
MRAEDGEPPVAGGDVIQSTAPPASPAPPTTNPMVDTVASVSASLASLRAGALARHAAPQSL